MDKRLRPLVELLEEKKTVSISYKELSTNKILEEKPFFAHKDLFFNAKINAFELMNLENKEEVIPTDAIISYSFDM